MKKAALGLLVPIVVLAIIVLGRAMAGGSAPAEAAPPLQIEVPGEAALQRFSTAITYQTISHAAASGTPLDREAFLGFHRFLAESFPLVHERLARETISEYSLLFTWPGRDPNLEPAVFLSHFDVVPADPSSLDTWTHPPFEGRVAEGFVWGRGALDDKVGVMGLLEATELLLERGYEPERTLYLSFGHDEELAGHHGAEVVAKRFRSQGQRLALVIDEGGAMINGVLPGLDVPVAAIGIAEKGYLNIDLSTESMAGHSSMPPTHTAVGRISSAIHRLERNQMPSHFEDGLAGTLEALAPHMGFAYRIPLQNLWLFGPIIEAALTRQEEMAPMVRTTTAATIFRAGVKPNVLPSRAEATVNFRIYPGDSMADVVEHARRVIDDEDIELRPWDEVEASPASKVGAPAWQMLTGTIHQLFAHAAPAPFLIPGGTDARYFRDLSEGVFGFIPVEIDRSDMQRAHGVDERVPADAYLEGIRFYAQLLANSGEAW